MSHFFQSLSSHLWERIISCEKQCAEDLAQIDFELWEGEGGEDIRAVSSFSSSSSGVSAISSPLFVHAPISARSLETQEKDKFDKSLRRTGKFNVQKEAPWGVRKAAKTVLVKMPEEEERGKGRKKKGSGMGSFSLTKKGGERAAGVLSAPVRSSSMGGKKGREEEKDESESGSDSSTDSDLPKKVGRLDLNALARSNSTHLSISTPNGGDTFVISAFLFFSFFFSSY